MTMEPIEILNEKISSLQKRGAVGLALFVSKNEDASQNDLARDTISHIDATLVPSGGVNIMSLRF